MPVADSFVGPTIEKAHVTGAQVNLRSPKLSLSLTLVYPIVQ
jgi:hypothetical protein